MGNLATFSGQARQGIREMLAQAHEIRLRGILTNAVVLGVALVVALLAGFALAGSILRPLQALAEGVRRIGEGDLSHRVVLASRDEIGQLARAFNAMTGRLETSQATLEVLSLRDGLTGLYNYREFRRRLKEEVDRSRRYGRPFSLLLLDLDHFKAVNDAHGHQAGDEVLREIANRIGQGVRPVDSVARYGGEEITIILPETAGSKAVVVGERIRGLIAVHPITIPGGATVRLTVSVGVAAFGEDGASDNDIISAADSALYAAKRAGRNRVCRLTRPDQSPPSPA
jgi:diguanylate cyclase (GGDEF)-like protein